MGTSVLEFDKPIAELERQIEELRQQAEAQKIDLAAEIAPLQQKLGSLREEVYRTLTPLQRVQVARSARRPFTLDYLRLAFSDFIE
ncbi:MAG: acetyl-CoA carboxylase carboxyl transferase subunit alpha, partial [Gemmatimonadota bacterium]